jgi:hypothetical protein
MLALSDEQLKQVKAAAAPIPARLRATYLERIAALLGDGRTLSHAAVRLACAQAQAFVLRSYACCPSWGEDDAA